MVTDHNPGPSECVVIVVDDDAAVRDSLRFSLESEGFSACVYASGGELLALRQIPDCGCLIVDQTLSDVEGIDLIAALRARHVDAPAIVMTSYPSSALKTRAAAAQVAVVEKPLLGGRLMEIIRQALSQKAVTRP